MPIPLGFKFNIISMILAGVKVQNIHFDFIFNKYRKYGNDVNCLLYVSREFSSRKQQTCIGICLVHLGNQQKRTTHLIQKCTFNLNDILKC